MVVLWNNAFEGVPKGSDFGSVSGLALRQTKDWTLQLYSAEHETELGVGAATRHRSGQINILGNLEEAPTLKEGSVVLLQDNSIVAETDQSTITLNDHSSIINAVAEDHPQYLAKSNDEIVGQLTVNSISRLTTSVQAYSSGNHFVLSKGGHPEDATAQHGTIDGSKLRLGLYDLSATHDAEYQPVTINWQSPNARDAKFYGHPDLHVANIPTSGNYTLSLFIAGIEVHARLQNIVSTSLYARPGNGGSSYQTNLAVGTNNGHATYWFHTLGVD